MNAVIYILAGIGELTVACVIGSVWFLLPVIKNLRGEKRGSQND